MFEFILGGSGTPLVRVTIVENGAGSFTFTLTQIGSGTDGAWQTGDLKGEIRGLFFDVDGNATNLGLTGITLDEGRTYSTLTGAVTTGGVGENDVTGFTKTYSDVNMNGAGLPEDGGYDVGVAIGTSGVGAKGDDVQGVTFTLTGLTGIDLEDFASQDFGLRMMSIGVVDANETFIGSRDGSAKIVGDSGDIATNEAPVATAASASGDEDTTSIAVTLTGADSDGTVASVRLTSLPSDGLLYTDALLTTLAATGVDYMGSSVIFYFVPDADFNGEATFDFTVTDNDGATDATPATATITVDAVNDAPEGTNNAVATDEDTTYVFATTDFGFSDPVEGDSLLAVKISTLPTSGILKLDGNLVLAGDFISAADIAAGKLKFEPDANANGAPYSDFTFQVQDDGGTGNGGVDLDQSANTMTINVDAVNDAPQGTDNTVTTDEDVPYVFAPADFGFSDPVEGDELLAVKITTLPTDGTLKLDGNAVSAGDFIGAADIAAGKLKFEPDANANGAPYSDFTFQVQDDGGTGNGGVDLDQSANTFTINVNPVNDAPQGTDNTVTTDEDTAYVFTMNDFGFTDPVEGDDLLAVKISTLPANGVLKLDGNAVLAGDLIAAVDIALGKLIFEPNANGNGAPYDSFTFQVQDDGGVANGGVDLDQSANTVTVDVNAVNDAPEGVDNTVTTDEDVPYVFAAADFGFSDPVEGDSLLAVKITTLPINGILELDGIAVSAGDFITVGDINDGKLTFTPAANANGNDYANFTFQVQDDGGTANGGVDLDQMPNAITVDVNAVNDAPVAVDDRWFISEKTNAQFGLAALLGNDTDVENDAKTVLAICTDGVNWVTDGSDGLVDGIITSGGVVVDLNAATVSYLTAGVTVDSDSSFLYRVADTGDVSLFDEGKVNVTTINIETSGGSSDQTINLDISPYNADSSSYAFIDADSGNDTVSGTQATVRFFGGQGNDTLSVGTFGANDTVHGGSNTTSLAGTNKGDVVIFDGALDLTAAGVSERITEIETLRMVDGVGNDSLTLNAQDVIDLGSGDFNPFGKDLVNEDAIRVDGDAGDTLNLTGGGWSLGAPAVSGNGDDVPTGYTLYVHDGGAAAGIQADAYVLVQTALNVTTP